MLVYLTIVLAAIAYFGWTRQAKRATFNLPKGLAETLIPQLEALQQAVEAETVDAIISSIRLDFEEVLRQRGVEPAEYRLILPPPGVVAAVWVEDSNGVRSTLAELDDRLDALFLNAQAQPKTW